LLSASVAIEGRSFNLYSQAYPLKEYTSKKTHRLFLNTLKNLLPENCKPIVITDAGFRNTWFKAVLKMGWDFIGRVRNNTQYCRVNQDQWLPIKSLYKQATEKSSFIGRVLLARESRLDCYFYLMKQKKKYRTKRNLAGKKVQCSVSKKHAKSAKEPWLIASSLSQDDISATGIMKLYKMRRHFEEVFRDLKNTRNGLGLRHCRSFKIERLNVALLIGALAMLVLWLVGIWVKQQKMHYSFQANTVRTRNVLSNVMIGWQALVRTMNFKKKEYLAALDYIASITATGEDYA
jgi:hypothetical protein